MNNIIKATIALPFAGIIFSVPLQVQDRSADMQDILVLPISEQAVIAACVAGALDEELQGKRFNSRMTRSGIVKVRFVTNGAGVADNISLYDGSGTNQLDRAALRAIRRMSDLAPSPFADGHGQLMQANIIFAGSGHEAERLARRLNREEATRIASRRSTEQAVLALTIAASPHS